MIFLLLFKCQLLRIAFLDFFQHYYRPQSNCSEADRSPISVMAPVRVKTCVYKCGLRNQDMCNKYQFSLSGTLFEGIPIAACTLSKATR